MTCNTACLPGLRPGRTLRGLAAAVGNGVRALEHEDCPLRQMLLPFSKLYWGSKSRNNKHNPSVYLLRSAYGALPILISYVSGIRMHVRIYVIAGLGKSLMQNVRWGILWWPLLLTLDGELLQLLCALPALAICTWYVGCSLEYAFTVLRDTST